MSHHTCEIEGVTVQFPFDPYDIQRDYMASVIRALQKRGNALLESPTGTGKTLSQQCAALGWREHELAKSQPVIKHDEESGNTSVLNHRAVQNTNKSQAKIAPIFYAARTHSQLSQIAKEQREVREPKQVRQLGSRTQYCSNPDVRSLPTGDQSSKCSNLRKENNCSFLQQNDRLQSEWSVVQDTMIGDIEGVMAYSKERGACGYFLSRHNLDRADLFLIPYNYLLDSTIRRRMGQEEQMKDSVIIIDEAHNQGSFCCENTSHELSVSMVSTVLTELEKVKTKFVQLYTAGYETATRELHIKSRFFVEPNAPLQAEDQIVVLKLSKLVELNNMLRDLEMKISDMPVTVLSSNMNEEDLHQKVHSGNFLLELLVRAKFPMYSAQAMKAQLLDFEALQEFLTASTTLEGMAEPEDEKVSNISEVDALRSHFIGFAEFLYKVHETSLSVDALSHYKCTVENNRLSNSVEDTVVKMMCFSSSVAMSQFLKLGVRSILITSGTLAPLESFKVDLGIPIQEVQENKHIVDQNQQKTYVVAKGPKNQRQEHSYKNKENQAMKLDTGEALLDICSSTPGGVLVFFASYSLMDSILTSWGYPQMYGVKAQQEPVFPSGSLMAKIAACKVVCKESKIGDFNAVLDKYNNAVYNLNGGILFGVARGKASEGVDFRNAQSRAVVIIGLPFPALGDNRVIIKRNFHVFREKELHAFKQRLQACEKEIEEVRQRMNSGVEVVFDREHDRYSYTNRLKTLQLEKQDITHYIAQTMPLISSGRAWYEQEAYRAVNQAIGRVIRHRHDYGTVYFLDDRFSYAKTRESLCKWLQPFLPTANISYAEMMKNVQTHWEETVPAQLAVQAKLGIKIDMKMMVSGENSFKKRRIQGVFSGMQDSQKSQHADQSSQKGKNQHTNKFGIDDQDYNEYLPKQTNKPSSVHPIFQKANTLASAQLHNSNHNTSHVNSNNTPLIPVVKLPDTQLWEICKQLQWSMIRLCFEEAGQSEVIKMTKDQSNEHLDTFQKEQQLQKFVKYMDSLPIILPYLRNPYQLNSIHPYLQHFHEKYKSIEKTTPFPCSGNTLPLMEPAFKQHTRSPYFTTKSFFIAIWIAALPIRLWDAVRQKYASTNAFSARIVQNITSFLGDEQTPSMKANGEFTINVEDREIQEQEKQKFQELLDKLFASDQKTTFMTLLATTRKYSKDIQQVTPEQHQHIQELTNSFFDLFHQIKYSKALANKMQASLPLVFRDYWSKCLAKL